MKKLRNIYFELTGACNLACHHCYIFNDKRKRARKDKLTLAVIDRVVRDAIPLGLSESTFTGGEIFLRPDIIQIAERCSSYGVALNFLSNLTMITDRDIEALCSLNVNIVSTSIDGFADTHDKFRGTNGSFEKTLTNITKLKKHDINVKASVTLGPHNLVQAEKLFDFLDNLNVPFSVARIAPIGRGTKTATIDDPEFDAAYSLLLAQRLDHVIPIQSHPSQLVRQDLVPNHCGVGRDILYVMSNGDVGFCPTLAPFADSKFDLGNVITSPIDRIWQSGVVLDRISSECGQQTECRHAVHCRSGCRANAFAKSGDIASCDTEMREAFDTLEIVRKRRVPASHYQVV